MRRTLVLINNTGIGGAERRLGYIFTRMAEQNAGTTLTINAGLWAKLVSAGLVSGNEERVWRLPEPCLSLAERVGLREGKFAFWLRKLDYLLFSGVLLGRYALAPRRLFHFVLGGAYVGLPLMLLRPDHRAVVSVVSNDLRLMVGPAWALPVYRLALARCHLIDALTEGVRADLIQKGISTDKILVSTGSVANLDRFRPSLKKEPWVVFAGRLVEEKNPLLFIDAVPAILREAPEARIFLLGEGPLGTAVGQALDRLGLRDAVETGFRPDSAPILGQARVFVSLQRQDNYPSQSLLEAMASGAVPVATDVGLTWKLVDETTGIRVKPDPEQIANAVIGLLKDSERCERLGRAARQRVEELHSEGRYRAHLDQLYARMEG